MGKLLGAMSKRPVHCSAAALQLDSLSLLGLQFCFGPERLRPSLCLTDPLGLLPLPLQPLLFQAGRYTLMGRG
ncbi:hypothetical protein EYF80_032382 [Liparis tanakae]|uniref:Uncharacterized protein n=1 Tax=Liparis tanakae TaxID=230148 RepID=A0A4Z2GXB2_9TELE|nr:hypothetical protein EYF80_032382 [Liparis tanakae]